MIGQLWRNSNAKTNRMVVSIRLSELNQPAVKKYFAIHWNIKKLTFTLYFKVLRE